MFLNDANIGMKSRRRHIKKRYGIEPKPYAVSFFFSIYARIS